MGQPGSVIEDATWQRPCPLDSGPAPSRRTRQPPPPYLEPHCPLLVFLGIAWIDRGEIPALLLQYLLGPFIPCVRTAGQEGPWSQKLEAGGGRGGWRAAGAGGNLKLRDSPGDGWYRAYCPRASSLAPIFSGL